MKDKEIIENAVKEINAIIKEVKKQLADSIKAEELWHNCIHDNISGFTLTQEKKAIADIKKYLKEKLKI